jgi:peptidyl-prolyl cis-trans isomerase B (cyclophilin B)
MMRTIHRPLIVVVCAMLWIGCEPNGRDKKISASKQKDQPVTTPENKPQESPPVVVLETSRGDIVIELNPDKAPVTVENFLQYVDDKFYDGVIFHRVMNGFMIQGGGFTPDMEKKETRECVKNEAGNGLSNDRGTIAMARTPDPHSGSSQFFINHGNNTGLNHTGQGNSQEWGYCVFGKVIDGMGVVDAIAEVRTGTKKGYEDVPVEAVVIQRAYRK